MVVIGGGIVGSAIARELSAYELAVALLEARADVGDGTSKANTAILHTGFDARAGTLESRLIPRGYALLSAYASRTGIPIERNGALLMAWSEEELAALPGLRDKAELNAYAHCKIISAIKVYEQIPTLAPGALGGLSAPDESIICTWTANLALATEAKLRGIDLRTGHAVIGVTMSPEHTVLHTAAGDVTTRWVVNAAGLGADILDRLFGYDRFTVTPRRGELLVFDKLARQLADRVVLPGSISRTVVPAVLVSRSRRPASGHRM